MNAATLASIIAAAAPLILAVLGETLTERAGIINLSLDGSMLLAALTGFVVASETGSVSLGFVGAAAVSATIALIVVATAVELRQSQVAVGFVLTLLATDLSTFLGQPYVRQPGESVPRWNIPLLDEIPYLGEALFQHNVIVYGAYLAVGACWWWLFRTRQGLEVIAVGESPWAAFARGLPVRRIQYTYTVLGGALIGVAGAAYSLDAKLGWSDGHTRNLGWIALAIVIFGGWHPVRAAMGAVLFAALQVAAIKLQPTLPSLSQVLPAVPFPVMILTLLIVYRPRFRRLAERLGGLRRFLAAEPPESLGRPWAQD